MFAGGVVPDAFERDMACGEAEWARLLAQALREARWSPSAASAQVRVGTGRLRLTWQPLPPRQIALLCLPMLRVRFVFDGVSAADRAGFMRHFDLHAHRGGG